ncbi:alpha/beta hydrolase [Actinokineospora auranticolor]|uniref:Alpha/beta hydrolase n=1 Tax=Actinokineospora auranticolor TaxID=155976 RepID=A0A2S6H1U9_9PSEU|nr:alpha/beta hydrolase [Actinokineospora auranticolor]PPK71400.1 hypothetical protein CLV40_101590 [Actinokineospora auranticolor]
MRTVRTLLAAACATAAVTAGVVAADAATGSTHYTSTLPDGAAWIADVPEHPNGTTVLFSHGFGPLRPQNAPDPATHDALLDQGYALVGSSYSGPSDWALATAVDDQFGALAAAEAHTGKAKRVIAWGQSMGGLVSALEAERGASRIHGALTTCGLVAGGVSLNDYQLDGAYAISELLAADQHVQLVRYANPQQATTAANALVEATKKAQNTAQGRARTALAAAFYNAPTWFTGPTAPDPRDYAAQQRQQAAQLIQLVLPFTVTGRYQVELAAGGNSAATAGVDYSALITRSPQYAQVTALYRQAGLDLRADLTRLTRRADIKADPGAVRTLTATSTATGKLAVPELNIHTVADQLIPVEHEESYATRVRRAGSQDLLRQAFVQGSGHCAFQPAGYLAALRALEYRLDTGSWADRTTPASLNAAAKAADLGAFSPYATFRPVPLTRG